MRAYSGTPVDLIEKISFILDVARNSRSTSALELSNRDVRGNLMLQRLITPFIMRITECGTATRAFPMQMHREQHVERKFCQLPLRARRARARSVRRNPLKYRLVLSRTCSPSFVLRGFRDEKKSAGNSQLSCNTKALRRGSVTRCEYIIFHFS